MTMTVLLAVTAFAGLAHAVPMTVADAQNVFPQYNMEQQNPAAFQTPCIDANGTMTIVANVGDITQDAIAVGMICQVIGYPPYQAGGTVSFDVAGAFLISHATVPGFPDAFALDFAIPLGTQTITITVTDTGWPEGCIDPADFLDFAGFDDLSVSTESMSWGGVQALFR
jgi:hypothetical protein